MKKVTAENIVYAEALKFPFKPTEYNLGSWGDVDFYCEKDGVLILLEIEKGQKHPNTNVLKVWPFLHENPEKKILLIQIIRPENKAPKNRLALCRFTGFKLEDQFNERFRYVHFRWSQNDLISLQRQLQQKLQELI